MPQNSRAEDAREASILVQESMNSLSSEQVAKLVAGVPTIGQACEEVRKAGWRACIAGNRITVDADVIAQFIGPTVGVYGRVGASWVVYKIAGTPPVWIVGAEPPPCERPDEAAAIRIAREEATTARPQATPSSIVRLPCADTDPHKGENLSAATLPTATRRS